jgi:hypothetical protein
LLLLFGETARLTLLYLPSHCLEDNALVAVMMPFCKKKNKTGAGALFCVQQSDSECNLGQ